jgi:predicted amidophosphoribosyltransferase
MRMQSIIRAIYPAQCVACDEQTEAEYGLCGRCWSDTTFIAGTICDTCGAPLPGEAGNVPVFCDDCMTTARPWDRGRAAVVYAGIGRRIVLGLKHGGRIDLAYPAALWMSRGLSPLVTPETLIIPVPLHWMRLARRRYNQSALLARHLGKIHQAPFCLDALQRTQRTKSLDGQGKEARFATLSGVIKPNPRRAAKLAGRDILLVDDVMTSGATLAACTEAVRAAGAGTVSIATLARVVKDA